jgi:hypothetical protein
MFDALYSCSVDGRSFTVTVDSESTTYLGTDGSKLTARKS